MGVPYILLLILFCYLFIYHRRCSQLMHVCHPSLWHVAFHQTPQKRGAWYQSDTTPGTSWYSADNAETQVASAWRSHQPPQATAHWWHNHPNWILERHMVRHRVSLGIPNPDDSLRKNNLNFNFYLCNSSYLFAHSLTQHFNINAGNVLVRACHCHHSHSQYRVSCKLVKERCIRIYSVSDWVSE